MYRNHITKVVDVVTKASIPINSCKFCPIFASFNIRESRCFFQEKVRGDRWGSNPRSGMIQRPLSTQGFAMILSITADCFLETVLVGRVGACSKLYNRSVLKLS